MVRNRHVVRALGVLMLIFVLFVLKTIGNFWFPRGGSVDPVEIVVEEGATLSSVMPQLKEKLHVRPFWMRVYARLSHTGDLHPGTFTIEEDASYAQILNALETVTETAAVTLTIPEGFSLAQIGARVQEKFPSITAEQWAVMTGINSPLETHEFVVAAKKPDNVDLEGYVFPDTYQFFADATAEDIVTTMLDEMQSNYEAAAATAPSLTRTAHEYLTLASIVEKEVRQPETRNMVAGIFANRLAIGMPLQSDATINYIIGGDDPSPTLADLEVASAYNTYQNPGLPPGPIASPGLTALQAALNPARTDYYYFLTTDTGEIYYAETHDQHVDNKYRYLK